MSSEDYVLIDLAEEERELTRSLVAEVGRGDAADTELGLYFVEATSRYGVLGRSVEAEVLWDQFRKHRRFLGEEYGPYEKASIFILVVDHQASEVAGAIRAIRHSPAGMKTLHDIATLPGWGRTLAEIRQSHALDTPTDRLWDVATLAARKRWRQGQGGTMAAIGLYHGVVVGSLVQHMEFIIAALDDVVGDLMVAFGVPWQRICDLPSICYLDSPATSPLLLDMRGLARTLGQASDIGRAICMGEGLEGVLSRPTIPVDTIPLSPVALDFPTRVPDRPVAAPTTESAG